MRVIAGWVAALTMTCGVVSMASGEPALTTAAHLSGLPKCTAATGPLVWYAAGKLVARGALGFGKGTGQYACTSAAKRLLHKHAAATPAPADDAPSAEPSVAPSATLEDRSPTPQPSSSPARSR